MSQRDDFKRTIAFGDVALSYMKRNELPAIPRNYELWYTYAAGFNPALNRAVDTIIETRHEITNHDVSEIYDRYLSPNHLGDRIDKVGTTISEELDGIINLVDSSLGSTGDYSVSLKGAQDALSSATTASQIKQLIRDLVAATEKTESTNQKLDDQLKESRAHITALQERLEAIRYESLTDELTTLANRRHFDQSIERAIEEATASGEALSLLLSDIDHFKKFNDTYGHQTGDQVLRLVALAVKHNVKSEDLTCRYGGEEFAVILPRADAQQAYEIAERIRQSVFSKELVKRSTGENLGRITISIGIANLRLGDTASDLIARADKALYSAKDAGRNTVRGELERKKTGTAA
ncbi:GGDEF domain-containing protein [Breoghania sp. L-A4]|uniref:GGDEF domain-containing protein n=1 Tax=Breoghania sp. L-A4 TaxID=2304600 RepID=UPI000E35D5F0|nr:GGDEF domain-containing protein [Breoghania sp. L-A4]AXS40519.1 GGDEF domain-containing protein [Breoghania sp. L-A4]